MTSSRLRSRASVHARTCSSDSAPETTTKPCVSNQYRSISVRPCGGAVVAAAAALPAVALPAALPAAAAAEACAAGAAPVCRSRAASLRRAGSAGIVCGAAGRNAESSDGLINPQTLRFSCREGRRRLVPAGGIPSCHTAVVRPPLAALDCIPLLQGSGCCSGIIGARKIGMCGSVPFPMWLGKRPKGREFLEKSSTKQRGS